MCFFVKLSHASKNEKNNYQLRSKKKKETLQVAQHPLHNFIFSYIYEATD